MREFCECCKLEPSIGVACIPGMPISIAWGKKCLEAQIIPYWAAVANTAMCGGLAETGDGWQELVFATLEYFKTDYMTFSLDVAWDIQEMMKQEEATL